jgi:hypothetical protein
MDDLAPEVAFAHLRRNPYALAGRERLLLARIEVEEAQHELARPRPASPSSSSSETSCLRGRIADVGVDDAPSACWSDSRLQLPQRHDARVVFVAQRQVQDEVLIADEAEPRELIVEAARRSLRWGFRDLGKERKQIHRPDYRRFPVADRPRTTSAHAPACRHSGRRAARR